MGNVAELLRSLVTAAVVAGLVEWTGGNGIGAAILLGLSSALSLGVWP